MRPEPGENGAAYPVGRDRLRVSHTDREQVLDTLKDAFVRGRLTKDEFDSRVAHTLASRTHADLAALTADLPPGSPTVQPARKPVRARPEKNTPVKRGARLIAASTVLAGGAWAGALLSRTDSRTDSLAVAALVWTWTVVWLGIVLLAGSVMLESRRSGRQLPPAPGDGGRPRLSPS
jgi:hypothetical protein